MRIVENTPARLVMRDRTMWTAWVCLLVAAVSALAFAKDPGDLRRIIPVALSLVFTAWFWRWTDVTFEKAAHACTMRRRDILRVTLTKLPFSAVTDIAVEPMPGPDDSGAINSRLSFVTPDGRVPMTASYGPSLERLLGVRETLIDVLFPSGPRPPAPDLIELLVNSGHGADAMTWMVMRDGVDFATARARIAAIRKASGG